MNSKLTTNYSRRHSAFEPFAADTPDFADFKQDVSTPNVSIFQETTADLAGGTSNKIRSMNDQLADCGDLQIAIRGLCIITPPTLFVIATDVTG